MRTEQERERHRTYMRKWNAAHPGYASALGKRRREKNPEHVRAVDRKCRQRRKEHYAKMRRKWVAKNREKVLALKRASYQRNKEKHQQRCREWQTLHPEKVKGYKRKWSVANLDKHAEYEHRRRGLKRARTIEDCSEKIRLLRRKRFCHWCCDKIPDGKVTIDHVVPLARGGLHSNDNLVAACLACNSGRRDKLVSEWNWDRPQRLMEAA